MNGSGTVSVAQTLVCAFITSTTLHAQIYGRPAVLKDVGIQQHMGAQAPLDVPFTDETGRAVTLRQYTGKPVILALVYYQCPSLCNLVLSGVVRAAHGLSFKTGNEYEVVAVSFDPREHYLLARDKKETYMKEYNRPGSEAGWHFLTGTDASIRTLADTVGFQYRYDPLANQYAHASAIMILTPDGRLARYFYGIDYPARDVRLGLVEASGGKIGSRVDAVQLFCFHYDVNNGKYSMVITKVLQLAGLATVGVLATFMILMLRRDARAARI